MTEYMCEEHGHRRECDLSEYGERICTECGMAVTGVATTARSTFSSPPTDSEHAEGDIEWQIIARPNTFYVSAFGLEDAAETAVRKVKNPQHIKHIRPAEFEYQA